MPYKCEKINLKPEQDRRRKLTDEQKQDIREHYATGTTSQRKLAAAYGVSRRLITFILDPEKKKRDLENRAARGGSKQYYDREKHTRTMREHRQYKQKLYVNGELKAEPGNLPEEKE